MELVQQYPWTLDSLDGLGRRDSSFSGLAGIIQPLFHDSQLPNEQSGLNGGNNNKRACEYGEHPRPVCEPPFVRRMFLAFFGVLLGVGFSCAAGFYAYEERIALAFSLWGITAILIFGVFLLVWTTGYTSTWCWWF
jgi:hypothetical protein